MIYYLISPLINAVMALILGAFILVKQRRHPASQAFIFLNLAVFVWSLFFFLWQLSKDAPSALFLCRALMVGSAFIAPAFFHWSAHMLGKWKETKGLVMATYVIAIIFVSLIGTPLIVKRVEPFLAFPYWPMAGKLFFIHIVNYFFASNAAIYLMWKAYRGAPQIKQNQIKFIILGGFIGFLSGATSFPQWYGVKVYPVFIGTVWLYTLIVFYTIIRYKLFEIDTVIHRTLLWILTSGLVLIPIGVMLYFTRSWMTTLNWIQLTFVMTGLFYLFLYYYRKMQPRIDRLFRRRKYDYYQVLGEIGQKIGSELDINNVVSRLFKELGEILYIRNGIVFVQQPGQADYLEAGSTGYSQLSGQEKKEAVTLKHGSALSQWLNLHERVLEREQVEVDPQYTPIKEEAVTFLNENSVEVMIPVIMEGKVNALIGIGKKENLQAYTLKDIELLENMGKQIGITIDNAMHHEDIVEKERLAEEMKLGREIQTALLPQEFPLVPGLIVRGLMKPAKEIGGDYYDFITLPDKGQFAVVIGDVSGKGVAAGLLMAMAKTAVHTLSQGETSPKQILIRTNNILNHHIGGQKFMTMLYFRWDALTRTLSYCSAGHEHILIYRANQGPATAGGTAAHGQVESIVSGGFMLGMLPEISDFLEDRSIVLNPADKVVLYTDGATEARNPTEDLFGLPRLIDTVCKYGSKPANELLGFIKEEVYSFIGTREQFDDITLVVLEAQ
jgi:serine phosphatase RsbU (regulator of sigma subunit)